MYGMIFHLDKSSWERIWSNTNSLVLTKYPQIWGNLGFIELDDGKIYRKPLYLMVKTVKTMVSCKFSLKPIHWWMGSLSLSYTSVICCCMVFHAVQLRRLWRVFQDLDEAGAMIPTTFLYFDIVWYCMYIFCKLMVSNYIKLGTYICIHRYVHAAYISLSLYIYTYVQGPNDENPIIN